MTVQARYLTAALFVVGLIFGYQIALGYNRCLPVHLSDPPRPRSRVLPLQSADPGELSEHPPGGSNTSSRLNQFGHVNDVQDVSQVIRFDDLQLHRDDDSLARALQNSVRVLCWVMTSPGNLQKRASHIRETWGRRCNLLLFISDADDPDFPAVGLDVKPGRSHLTSKTMKAFDYVYERHANEADWFLKTDDDTYVIMENLRYLLSAHSPQEPIYFGEHFHSFVRQGYFSGGAGYVLSREALRRFGSRDLNACALDGGAEDVQFGLCMDALGVRTGNARDRLNRTRFHSLGLRDHIQARYPDWYRKAVNCSNQTGIEAISDYPVSFHYVNPTEMHVLEYFLYHASVYGIIKGLQQLNPVQNLT